MSILNKLNKAGYVASTVAKKDVVSTVVREASPAQVTWYTQLCQQKQIEPTVGWEFFNSKELSDEIRRVQSLPSHVPASERQISFIKEMMNDMGINAPDLSSLSVTRATEMIERLKKAHDSFMANKPSKKQLELLANMLLCPDCNEAELIGIPDELIEEYIASKDNLTALYAVKDIEIGKLMKKGDSLAGKEKAKNGEAIRNTREAYDREIEENIQIQLSAKKALEEYENSFDVANLSKEVVSEFIGKYQPVYRDWLRTRASEGQRNLINSLLVKNGQAELEYQQLIQYSREEATKAIAQLQLGKVYNIGSGERNFEFNREVTGEQRAEYLEEVMHSIGAMANFSPDDVKDVLVMHGETQFTAISQLSNIAIALNGEAAVVEQLERVFTQTEIDELLK